MCVREICKCVSIQVFIASGFSFLSFFFFIILRLPFFFLGVHPPNSCTHTFMIMCCPAVQQGECVSQPAHTVMSPWRLYVSLYIYTVYITPLCLFLTHISLFFINYLYENGMKSISFNPENYYYFFFYLKLKEKITEKKVKEKEGKFQS